MNCQECREELAAYLEGVLDESRRSEMDCHLAVCSSCQSEIQAVRALTVRLTRAGLAVPPVSLETVVMDRIFHEQALQLRRLKMRKRLRVLGLSGAMATAIAVLLVGTFWFAEPAVAEKTAAEVLAQGAKAVPNPTSVHVLAKMRTLPNDNFSMIGAEYGLVPVNIWKQFGEKPKWRVEKPGRVAVMDGASTVMLIRPDCVVQFPKASHGAFDTGWLLALTNVQDMISHERRVALANDWAMTVKHETVASGETLVVTVEAKSGLPEDDYLKNKFFDNTDMRRVYRFDAKTNRLHGFDAWLCRPEGDLLILTVERIEYDKTIDPAVFTLKLPNKVSLYQEPQRLSDNEKYERMTPEQAARTFFEACAKKDWDEAKKFMQPLDERIQSYLGGLEIVSLGKPFQSKGGYGGWFVPYEIKLTMKVQFTVRNDNPAKRYVVFSPGDRPEPKRLAELKALPDSAKYEKMTPKEILQALMGAYVKKDVGEAQKYVEGATSIESTKKEIEQGPSMVGFQVGEAAATKEPGCWAVPVEITVIRKHNLALRSDNPAKRYVVDGGI
jgi:hypothetical protein